jgi:hypothetical protein
MLLGDNEPGAEVYVAAADREQARILFKAAKAMVEAHPQLEALIVYRNQIVRADDPTAFFQVLSAEAATKHGPNIHCLIIDELHAQPDRDLFETLTRGVIARRQPLILRDHDRRRRRRIDLLRGVRLREARPERHDHRRAAPAGDLRGDAERKTGRSRRSGAASIRARHHDPGRGVREGFALEASTSRASGTTSSAIT